VLSTAIFFKDIRGYDYGVAHLYEHILVRGFRDILKDNGTIDGIWGWISGETFPEMMFISAGFYDDRVRKQFLVYINSSMTFDTAVIKQEIERIEAEDDANINYNIDEIIDKLRDIDSDKFVSLGQQKDVIIHVTETKKTTKSKYLIAKNSKQDFQNFSIKIGVKNPTELEKEIFLRLNILAGDVVARIVDSLSGYGYFRTGPIYNIKDEDFIYELLEQTIRKDKYNEKKIHREITSHLRAIDFKDQKVALDKYIKGYYEKTSCDIPIEYFRTTGIVTSKYHIYKLFTPENVQKAWGKLEVKIEKAK
jgi:hypothetical protein